MMSVESAIRRVINLRLKAPGTFWTAAMGECFLFLRHQIRDDLDQESHAATVPAPAP
jgi:hypothetical protein